MGSLPNGGVYAGGPTNLSRYYGGGSSFGAGGVSTGAPSAFAPPAVPKVPAMAGGSGATPNAGSFSTSAGPSMAGPSGTPAGMVSSAQANPALPNLQKAANTVLGQEGGAATSTDPNESWLINTYKNNVGAAPTQHMLDVATGQIRSSAAGERAAADEAAAARGGYAGGAPEAIESAEAMAEGTAAGNIATEGQKLTDEMILGGEPIMATPVGQRQGAMALENQTVAGSELPIAQTSFQEPLSAEELALQQYLGTGNLNLEAQGLANNSNLGYLSLLMGGMNSLAYA